MTGAAVLGAGSWGTAFALVLADAGATVGLWARRRALADAMTERRENPDYLPGVRLPAAVTATADVETALAGTRYVFLAVPAQELRSHLVRWAPLVPADAVLVSLAKGVELHSGKRMSEVIAEAAGVRPERVAVVTGPNLAREVAERQPAASVVASVDAGVARRLQRVCHSPAFRPYTNADVVGCELAGAAKNVIALAVGIAVGLGFGDNTRASLITRGLAEVTRLGVALGADPHTFAGLAGLGDLVATCSSPLSRNRQLGTALGEGRTVAEAGAGSRQVAEGVRTCAAILELAGRHRVEMPVAEHVTRVVRGELSPSHLIASLVSRGAKPERHGW
ncbi:glycerol-3-phosphate dehydrogenase (NAD(P)+) [Actinopolymorpha cephalotaxi]|uniref:Glycerol-3-phosphate dehydrogenase [NAD(P)+] n=1 Tax=Actinopolymorpha cephalotaxi TaxID=504797 RepID=A0A1I3AK72_9ACTN|nr:NAD(P)H-dependent glycerol-3-phosphate dehydrogenase [Actinopolymorpha cephalotaxi]NYH82188.1 glycerol-3-phosphate dehydrogenase (NAD(P)+) [Actinopolymorpha cephalotaxi]SFH50159.1 glycerol-3-phosphate dehydrogenase (NAD(P)+) [Actinopolymorpha cephalotaxi]